MTTPRVLLLLVGFLAAVVLAVADIGVGDTREEVLRQLGNPTSHAKRGDREILMYPKGGRVELLEGKVVDVKGPLPSLAPAPTAPAEAPAAETSSAEPTPNTPAPNAATPAAQTAGSATNPTSSAAVNPMEALSKHVEKMDTAWGERPTMPAPETFNWLKFAGSLILHFGITLLALWIAFKIEEMDALWSGTLAIAAIDLVVYGILEALGPATGGISDSASVQGGIGALVMVATIQKFCFNKRLQNAVITAMSVKLVVQLCHIFVFVLVLNALFG